MLHVLRELRIPVCLTVAVVVVLLALVVVGDRLLMPTPAPPDREHERNLVDANHKLRVENGELARRLALAEANAAVEEVYRKRAEQQLRAASHATAPAPADARVDVPKADLIPATNFPTTPEDK